MATKLTKKKAVCVFCGSSMSNNDGIIEQTKKLGQAIVERQYRLVYGGACVGLMGLLADTVLESSGDVVGVIPRFFNNKEIAHPSLNTLLYVDSLAQRKHCMAEMSDAFIALPGGVGTLDEIFEMLTLAQLDIQKKPIILLNVDHFYDHLLAQMEQMQENQLLNQVHQSMLQVANNIDELFQKIESYQHPKQEKWIRQVKD